MPSKIDEHNLTYVHRALLEREYAALVEKKNTAIALAFVIGIWTGTVATILVTLWWMP